MDLKVSLLNISFQVIHKEGIDKRHVKLRSALKTKALLRVQFLLTF